MEEYDVYKKLYGSLAYDVRHHPTYLRGVFNEGMFIFFNRIVNIGLTSRTAHIRCIW